MKPTGAATVELALVLPLLVAIIWYGLYLAQLAQAKLDVQEAARNAAWEMTGHLLSDYGQGKHSAAFDQASAEISKEATQRGLVGNWVADNGSLQIQVADERPALSAAPLPQAGGTGRLVARMGTAARSLAALFDTWKLNVKGQTRAEARMDISGKILPLHQRLESTHTLVADGWQLVDGADSDMANGRAGNHDGGVDESGLHRQVERMTFLGVRSWLEHMQSVDAAIGALGVAGLPAFTGTFVVSHNYLAGGTDRHCYTDVDTTRNPAPSGLNNVEEQAGLDWSHPRCFDTAPFRDVAQYDKSLYVQMFKARGQNFMGCLNPQADDPTTLHFDASSDHTPCAP